MVEQNEKFGDYTVLTWFIFAGLVIYMHIYITHCIVGKFCGKKFDKFQYSFQPFGRKKFGE